MLRDPGLVPLSHQHQRALALCVFLRRAPESGPPDLAHWSQEIARAFEQELHAHFEAEESILFPAARSVAALLPLVEELLAEHARLRDYAQRAAANRLQADDLAALAALLDRHIRKEERRLFEQMQQLLPAETLEAMGQALQRFFRERGVAPSCRLPSSG
ncbi:MAG: hemerythrin domain-containing protein [Terriglobales bacterium]